jgi:putative FmdB family regulatory protein
MPIYEYTCKECGNRFETLRSFKDADAPIPCLSCQSIKTQRAVSVFYAQSGSRIIAGSNTSGCAGCSSGSCSSCNSN